MEAEFPTFLGLLDGLLDRVGLLRARPEQEPAIPVSVWPEAAARIAELGLEREVQAMLAYTRRRVRRVLALEVVYHGGPDELGHFPYPMGIFAWIDPKSDQVLSSVQARWLAWRSLRFPGRVRRLFGFSLFYRWPGQAQATA
jgi:hypothetical protein